MTEVDKNGISGRKQRGGKQRINDELKDRKLLTK